MDTIPPDNVTRMSGAVQSYYESVAIVRLAQHPEEIAGTDPPSKSKEDPNLSQRIAKFHTADKASKAY